MIVHSGDAFLRLAAFYLMFSQAGAAWSVDRLIRIVRGRESGPPPLSAPWAMRMIQIQVCILYGAAVLWKLRGERWLDGTATYYTSRLQEFWRFPVPYVFEHLWTIKFVTWASLAVEFGLAALVWVKEYRYPVLLLGILLHAGIDYSMNIPLFGPILVAAYITWVDPADLDRFGAWLRGRLNACWRGKEPIPVFYDGACSFCIRSVEILQRLDLLRRLRLFDMHAPQSIQEFSDLDRDRSAQEMLVREANGNWSGGFSAFRVISWQMPLTWPIVLLLYVPGVRFVGNRVYRRIAEHRHCLIQPQASLTHQAEARHDLP